MDLAVLRKYSQDLSLLRRMADTIKTTYQKQWKCKAILGKLEEMLHNFSNNRKLVSYEITVEAFISDHLGN